MKNIDDLGHKLLTGSLLDDLQYLKNEVAMIEERQKEEEQASREINENKERFWPLGQTTVDILWV